MQAADSSERLGKLIMAILGSCFALSLSPCTRNFLLHIDLFSERPTNECRIRWRKAGAGKSGFKNRSQIRGVQRSVLGTFETYRMRLAMSEFEGKAENICSH
jgi:hypothetical protein